MTFARGYAAISCGAKMQPGRSAMASCGESRSAMVRGRPEVCWVLRMASCQIGMWVGLLIRVRIVYGL